MVGLLPICAATVVEQWQRERLPSLTAHVYERLRRMPELATSIHATGPGIWLCGARDFCSGQ